MTGYTTHTGSNEKYRKGWDSIFAGKQAKQRPHATKNERSARKDKVKRTQRGR